MKKATEKTLRGFSFGVLSFIVPAVLLLQGCPNPSVTAPPTPSGAPKIEYPNPETGPTADASAGSAVKDAEDRVIGTIIIQKDASGSSSRKLKISPSLTAVTASAFSGLNLTSVIIPASVKSIGPRAFAVNPNLKSVTISQSLLNSTNPNAFPAGVSFKDGVGGLISSSLKNNPIIEDTEGSKITVTVDGSGKTVFKSLEVSPKLTAIPASRFANQGLTSVLIPEGVTSISTGAFMSNPGLTSVTLSQELLNTLDIPATPAGQFSASMDSGAVNFQAAGSGGNPSFPPNVVFSNHQGKVITPWKDMAPVTDGDGSVTTITRDKNGTGRIAAKSLLVSSRLTSIPANKFANQELTAVTVPTSVTKIDSRAFANNPNLKSVTISQQLLNNTPVGTFPAGTVFRHHSGRVITQGNVARAPGRETTRRIPGPEGFVTIVVKDANNGVISRTLEVASSVTSIKYGQFQNKGLTHVKFITPSSLSSIRDNAFANNKITRITIPNSVIDIGEHAFAENRLGSLTISDFVNYIGDSAFRGNQLTTLNIPNSVNSIEQFAFADNQIASLTIGNSLTTIERYAFTNNRLTTLTIPNSITSIKASAFRSNRLTTLTIPNSITSIKASAFRSNRLTTLTIPNSVTSIGAHAFANNRLTSLTIPSSITSIGDKQFAANPNLTSITIAQKLLNDTPAGAFPIDAVFKNHSGTVITRWVTERIPGPHGFVTIVVKDGNNTVISKTLEVGSSVGSIAYELFRSKELTHIHFIEPSSLYAIQRWAFEDNRLTSLTIPKSVTWIGHGAFADNPDLKSITISQKLLNDTPAVEFPAGVVFKNHSGKVIKRWVAERIPGPNGFVTIVVKDGNNAVIRKTLEVASSVTSIADGQISSTSIVTGLFQGKGITHVNFIAPSSLSYIGSWAFAHNRLTSVTIPSSVTSIENHAFYNNRLTTVTVPSSVTTIGGGHSETTDSPR